MRWKAWESLPTPPFILIPSRKHYFFEKTSDVLGVPEAGASVAREMQRRLADLQQRVGALAAKRVLFVVWTQPLISVGKGHLYRGMRCAAQEPSPSWIPTKDGHRSALRKSPAAARIPCFRGFAFRIRFPAVEVLATLPGWSIVDAVSNRRFCGDQRMP